MRQTVENTTKKCTPERALFSLLTSYAKEDVDFIFTDIKTVFMEWLGTNHADDTQKRESIAHSMEILSHLESVVTGISKKKIKILVKEFENEKAKFV